VETVIGSLIFSLLLWENEHNAGARKDERAGSNGGIRPLALAPMARRDAGMSLGRHVFHAGATALFRKRFSKDRALARPYPNVEP
jgi:hypothetical protein